MVIDSDGNVFQFHYGSIVSVDTLLAADIDISFQFHYGSIVSLAFIATPLGAVISIPLWFDCEEFNRRRRLKFM